MKTDRTPTPAELARLAARTRYAAGVVYAILFAPLCCLATLLLLAWGLPEGAEINGPTLLWTLASVLGPAYLAARAVYWLTAGDAE